VGLGGKGTAITPLLPESGVHGGFTARMGRAQPRTRSFASLSETLRYTTQLCDTLHKHSLLTLLLTIIVPFLHFRLLNRIIIIIIIRNNLEN